MCKHTSAPKGNSIFEILLVKVFSLKQKKNQILSSTIEKKTVLSLQEKSLMSFYTMNFAELSNHVFK